jgi:hypothetical protein
LIKSKKLLVILDSSIPIEEFKNFPDSEYDLISVDYDTHKKLMNSKIDHKLLDDYLNKTERTNLYNFVLSKYKWYNEISNKVKFEFEKINLLSLMSPLEFHEFILTELIKFTSIKNLIKNEKPEKIFVSKKFLKYIQLFENETKINIIKSSTSDQKGFLTDKIEIKFNIFSKPCTFYVSKTNYTALKKIYENFLCTFNNLWMDKKTSNEIILLLEFNTSSYAELIKILAKSKKQIVLLNRRRSAIWNKESIKILKSYGAKILDYEKYFDSHDKRNLSLETNRLNQNLNELWNSQELLSIFSINEISFWPLIKERFMKIFKNRLSDYMRFIVQSKIFLEQLKIKKIICLGESGETENIILQNNKNNSDSILLQHSFLRYNPEINNLQWKYEDQNMIGIISKNFFVWGNNDFNYFSQQSSIDNKKLIISGSPRHDKFFRQNLQNTSEDIKNILITLSPISERSGLGDTHLIEKYNNFLKKVIDYLKNFYNLKIVIKLHPGENPHNAILLSFLEKISGITIYHTKNSETLIEKSNLMINFSPELYDSSTIMLEGLIFKKPVIQLILDDNLSKISSLNSPIFQISTIENFEKLIKKLIEDQSYRNTINEQITKKLENYLSYQNFSSQRFLELIDN